MKLAPLSLAILAFVASCRHEDARNEPSVARAPRSVSGPVRVVCLGDSLAYGAGDETGRGLAGWLKEDLRARGVADVTTVNLGVNGATTADVTRRLGEEKVRKEIASADAIVLSVGANDLFQTHDSREEAMRAPMRAISTMLDRVTRVVERVRGLNPRAQIMILGGYNPVPAHPLSILIDRYIGVWDGALAERFESDPLVSVIQMADIVSGPARLSSRDHFHPGSSAYHETSKRIATVFLARSASVS